MKRILGTMFAVTAMAALSVAAPAQANQKTNTPNDKTTGSYESKSTNTTTTDTSTTKTTSDTFYGKLEEYKLGKFMKISTPGKTEGTKTVSLDNKDETYHIAPNLKVGDWIAVTEKTDNHGKKVMTIAPSKHAARTE
jgi:hypothetical protein